MKKSADKLGKLVKNYEKLSTLPLLGLPHVEKKDIPDYIHCPRYVKEKNSLDAKMKTANAKVERACERLRTSEQEIERLIKKRDELDPGSGFWVNKEDRQAVKSYNDRLEQARKTQDKIETAVNKHGDLELERDEAIAEAKEKLEELTANALLAIDEDIPTVIDGIESIASNFADSDDGDDLLAAIDCCLIALRIYAMFEDLIDGNRERKDCKEGIAKINQTFSNLCAEDSIQNYMVDLYRRNLDLVQKNAMIAQQIDGVLASVDQKQLDAHSYSINTVLALKVDTNFNYSSVIDPAEIDKIVVKIKSAIDALKQNIEKVKAFQAVETPAIELGRAGVKAEQQAKSLRASMQTNLDALDSPLTQNHFAIQIIDEAVIDNFYQKELRVAVSGLRKHIIDTIGEANFESVLKGGDDRFSLQKGQRAIDKANLARLQATLDKIPRYIRESSEQISSAESDINKANEVPKRNADALNAELGSKYIVSCIPIIGLFTAIGIRGRVKTFEPAFCGTNKIYKDLGNTLIEKNGKMTIVVLIIGAILSFGSFALIPVGGLPLAITFFIIFLIPYGLSVLMLFLTGKLLKEYLGIA